MSLTADARSLRVLDGTGGMSALDDGDKDGISQTIDEEVLKGAADRSSARRSVVARGSRLRGARRARADALQRARSRSRSTSTTTAGSTGSAMVKQTDWKMKPFSALFGTLKVADVVEVDDRRARRCAASTDHARSEQHG